MSPTEPSVVCGSSSILSVFTALCAMNRTEPSVSCGCWSVLSVLWPIMLWMIQPSVVVGPGPSKRWYDLRGWLGVKHQLSIYLSFKPWVTLNRLFPWYDLRRWLGVKHQLSIYLSFKPWVTLNRLFHVDAGQFFVNTKHVDQQTMGGNYAPTVDVTHWTQAHNNRDPSRLR